MVNINYEPIVPQQLRRGEQIAAKEIEKALKKEAQRIQREMVKPTKTWEHKVTVEVKTMTLGEMLVTADDDVYNILDKGSKPHKIRAVNAPRLAFFSKGFKPKTKVGSLKAFKGSAANRDFVRPLEVQHPGTKPRNWSKIIADESKERFFKDMQRAINRIFK